MQKEHVMSTRRKVRQLIETLSIEEKVGQLFVLAFAGNDVDYAINLVKDYHVGGFYITDDNAHSAADAKQLSSLLQQQAALRSCDAPLLLAVDQEGAWGILTQETDLGPGNLALGKANDLEQTQAMYQVFAEQMQALGYNTLLSPCADINSNPNNPIIGQRSFGEQTLEVAQHVDAAVKGVLLTGNLACAKHFPGHGDTAQDSHRTLPTVNKSLAQLKEQDLQPFASAINANVSLIMTAHINYPQIDPDYPATLSKTILTDILKGQLGFDGLIITDSMNMWAMRHYFSPSEAAILSIKAGAHLIMLSEEHYENEATPYKEIQQQTIKGVIDAVKTGELSEQQIDESLQHILCFKYRKLVNNQAKDKLTKKRCQQISSEAAASAIRVLKNKEGLFPLEDKPFILACAADPKEYEKLVNSRGIGPNDPHSASSVFIDQLNSQAVNFTLMPFHQLIEVLEGNEDHKTNTPMVLLTEDYPLPGEDFDNQQQTIRVQQAAKIFGNNLIVLALRSDYELEHFSEIAHYICAYSSRKDSAKALANALIQIKK
ncbi:MAG: beta-N-acetylhexosaminidase [Alteromonadaceae bacterium]